MKLVTTMHGWTRETLRTRFYYRIDRQCIERYDRVITVGPTLHQACAAMHVRPERETYIPNAIDLEGYHRGVTPAQRRQALGLPAGRLAIGVVSRLSGEKGVDRALRAFAGLRARQSNCDLHIIGAGPEEANLRALAQDLGLGAGIRFWGWQRQPQPYYEMMDLLLLPSRTEGMPNVVLEAMAMGVPVAATDVGGVRELLDGGRCGVILDQNQANWPAQISPLLWSPAYRSGLALEARRRVEERYSYHRWIERLNAVYADVLGLRPAAERVRRAA
jgi:glycosyltransferase involved in cell wall biosynthesis